MIMLNHLYDVVPGEFVVRNICGAEMELKVSEVKDGVIYCGPWKFDQQSGAEIDEDLEWGPKWGKTGSYITKNT